MGVDGSFLLGLGGGFLIEERLTVGHWDLVIVGMDFVEGEEAVAVAAVLDEGRLQRRLNARHLGEIDIAPKQLSGGGFEIEFLYPAVAEHHDPGLLRVRGVDKHLVVWTCVPILGAPAGLPAAWLRNSDANWVKGGKAPVSGARHCLR